MRLHLASMDRLEASQVGLQWSSKPQMLARQGHDNETEPLYRRALKNGSAKSVAFDANSDAIRGGRA